MRDVAWRHGHAIRPDLVSAFEAECGFSLPARLREIAIRHDGGMPRPDGIAFADPEMDGEENVVGFGQLYKFADGSGDSLNIFDVNKTFRHAHPQIVLFAGTGEGWDIGLDYGAGRDAPAVVLIRSDVGDGPQTLRVADDFDAFLSGLFDDDAVPMPDPSPGG